MKTLINEEEEKEGKIKLKIATEEKDDCIEIKIVRQNKIRFRIYRYTCSSGRLVTLDSVNNAQYCSDGSNIIFYLEGSVDNGHSLPVKIPKEEWADVKEALIDFGAIIDGEPEPNSEPVKDEIEKIDYNISSLKPTEDEIKRMIDLVDIDTFNKIIKNRLILELPNDKKEILGKINRKWAREYLRKWAINKYRFYKIFGNKLSISKKIEIGVDRNSIASAVGEIKEQFPLYAPILENIDTSAFALKQINEGNISRNFFKDKKIKSGMSITKLISLYGNKELDTAISKMYQDVGKNTIYLSINPIDYLTVSINASGWESCHHFLKGCYRNAGLSYMLDRTSFISFASKNDVPYAFEFPYNWNTKNWRQMVYMSEKNSSIVFSRQYPYDSDDMSKAVRELFESLVSSYFNSINKWKVYSDESTSDTYVENCEHSLVYNDVDNGYRFTVVKAKDDINFEDRTYIYIGEEVSNLFDCNKYLHHNESYLIDDGEYEEEDYD